MILQDFLAQLGPERRPVSHIWRDLGIERRDLTAFIATHRGELAAAGVQLHTATHSQAGRLDLYLEADGHRIAALSRPIPANRVQLTYREEWVRCGKAKCRKCSEGQGHGPYWYAYWREAGKVKKKYLGKTAPGRDMPGANDAG